MSSGLSEVGRIARRVPDQDEPLTPRKKVFVCFANTLASGVGGIGDTRPIPVNEQPLQCAAIFQLGFRVEALGSSNGYGKRVARKLIMVAD